MMTINNILARRHLYDLIMLTLKWRAALPACLTEEEWKLITFFAEQNDRGRVDYYLELAEEKDEHTWMVNREDFETEESFLEWQEYRNQEYKTIVALEKADHQKAQLADNIAGVLMQEDTFSDWLGRASDSMIRLLRLLTDMADTEDMEHEDGFYDLTTTDDAVCADQLQQMGYAISIFMEARKSNDSHRHVTGIYISSDVLKLFEKILTPEFDLQRRVGNLVSDACYMARSYYEAAPLYMAMYLYETAAADQPDLPRLSKEEFVAVARKTNNGLYEVFQYKGETFILEQYLIDDLIQTENEADSILFNDVARMEAQKYAFYKPDASEILEYLEYGYWPSRGAYLELREFLTEYYEEERELENMVPKMMSAFAAYGAEDDEYYLERYTLDDVEENVDEKIGLAVFFLMIGNDVDDVMESYDEIPGNIKAESKEKLMQILERCRQQANKTWLLGHIEELQK